MHTGRAGLAWCIAASLVVAVGCASQSAPDGQLREALAPTYAGPVAPPGGTLTGTPQTVPATVQPNASQAIYIPVPANNDFSRLPLVASDTPNLVVASTQYSGDQKDLVVSVMNVDAQAPTSGHLDIAGWGSFGATVQPDPSQLVTVPVPSGYDTSTLPPVSSDSPNLILFSVTYSYAGGAPQLAVTVGNPFPDAPVSGSLLIDW